MSINEKLKSIVRELTLLIESTSSDLEKNNWGNYDQYINDYNSIIDRLKLMDEFSNLEMISLVPDEHKGIVAPGSPQEQKKLGEIDYSAKKLKMLICPNNKLQSHETLNSVNSNRKFSDIYEKLKKHPIWIIITTGVGGILVGVWIMQMFYINPRNFEIDRLNSIISEYKDKSQNEANSNQSSDQSSNIYGKVIDTPGKIKITLNNDSAKSVYTDAKTGFFRIDEVKMGLNIVEASIIGYHPEVLVFRVDNKTGKEIIIPPLKRKVKPSEIDYFSSNSRFYITILGMEIGNKFWGYSSVPSIYFSIESQNCGKDIRYSPIVSNLYTMYTLSLGPGIAVDIPCTEKEISSKSLKLRIYVYMLNKNKNLYSSDELLTSYNIELNTDSINSIIGPIHYPGTDLDKIESYLSIYLKLNKR